MAKTKTVSFDEQIQMMEDTYGINKVDTQNVFKNYEKVFKDIITRETENESGGLEIVNPLGSFALRWAKGENRIDTATGKEFEVPGRYIFNFGVPNFILETANRNIDFSSVPSSQNVATAKKKVA